MEEWKAIHPNPSPKAYLLSFRRIVKAENKVIWNKRMLESKLGRDWVWLQGRYNLPYLRPSQLRHWVCTICEDVVLMTANARCYMQGHDPRSEDRTMGAVYNNRPRDKALEEQAALLPNGVLGTLEEKERPQDQDELPNEFKALCIQLYQQEIGITRFGLLFEEWQMNTVKAQAQQIGPGM
jgi:hypothetical protein